ncbi:hypothetical protein FRB94_003325 [Tulasnella sp. JGI-2019a]|nr:hypothetical protein FRB94_003325 [Tulasnella sp. JGI-2019a]
MAAILTDVAALDVAAYVSKKLEKSGEDGSQRHQASAEERYPHSIGVAAGAMAQSRGGYHPFVSMTDAAVYLPQARPSVTFEPRNQLDRPGGTERKGTGGGTGPALTVLVSPVLHPISAALGPRPNSHSFKSESTMRQIRSTPMVRYDQDRRDRERGQEREQRRAEEQYGLTRGRQWDDDRSISTTRVRYASPTRSDDMSISTTQHRDASSAWSGDSECVCSSCRNAWVWRTIEYCGLAVALILYLVFMVKLLFQNQGIRLIWS